MKGQLVLYSTVLEISFYIIIFPTASLSKIREFHASFKAICDNFRIDLTEFEQIFSTNETSFAIWDTDDNGFIDALELFSGLVVFADCKFQDKIRCTTNFPSKNNLYLSP